jgi:hypothetical protein
MSYRDIFAVSKDVPFYVKDHNLEFRLTDHALTDRNYHTDMSYVCDFVNRLSRPVMMHDLNVKPFLDFHFEHTLNKEFFLWVLESRVLTMMLGGNNPSPTRIKMLEMWLTIHKPKKKTESITPLRDKNTN